MRVLTTPLCTLEPQLASHAAEMFEVLSDPAIYEFENAPPVSEAGLRTRFAKLETRRSADGTQQWLNWVIRLPNDELAGYVQATVLPSGAALVAYELASRYWRRGIGSSAVGAMLHELACQHGVSTLVAVLKAGNFRSLALLASLGFAPGSADQAITFGAEPGEVVMVKTLHGAGNPA